MDGPKPLVYSDRALSQAVLAAMTFAITIAVVAGAGMMLMQSGGDLQDTGPVVSVTADPIRASNGPCCQRVRLNHRSGATLNLTRLELVVRLPDHDKQARLHDLPTRVMDKGDYTGHHVFTLGDGGIGGVADADTDPDGTYEAGDVIEFRIAPERADLQPGDHVEISLRYGDSGSKLREVNATVVPS